ncbi:2-dehydropantoate 2-reductase [Bombilactobacillus folatiphilus]|uniref:2-dehydropantoate 2-reductase n=1 Tax=Bombilactobacillus folatiphilus TaxID=2923362 RepID=A0ABY4PAV5_9LACO|nr:2-dehydropantoate 2-reductase [Bombilactobacillus folatiphilus]UQS82689.1 2-dehydropantoate 2-reductase [Bombilactobacillus folatiphilus]
MRIAVVGVGAMGNRFGYALSQAGNDVTLVDGWQPNVEAIRQNGLRANLNGEEVQTPLPIYYPSEVNQIEEPVDLIVVFTKSYQLEEYFDQIKPLLTPQTYVLCLMNGMGHENILEKYVDQNLLLIGVTMFTAGLDKPGHAQLFGDGNVEIQNLGPKGETFAKKVVETLSQAKLNAKYSTSARYSIWRKACVNGTLNSLCSLLECNMGELGQTKEAKTYLKDIIAEFAAVAKHENIVLDQDEVFHHIDETFYGNIANHYPSMYQDLVKNHRMTEIDFINGAVWRRGQKYGVPTPECRLLTQLIHSKEQLVGAKLD